MLCSVGRRALLPAIGWPAGVCRAAARLRPRDSVARRWAATLSVTFPDRTYYEATANARRSFPAVAPGQTVDAEVCIVGGGFAGVNTALALTERQCNDVVLLEQHEIGHGASGRNGGFVFGGFSLGERDLVAQLGTEKARALYRLTLDAVELIRTRIDRFRIACDRVDGGVLLGNWFDDDDLLRDIQNFMKREMNVEWQWVSRDELRTLLSTERYSAALREPHAFHFHPLNYVLGLAEVISARGVRVFTHSAAARIDRNPNAGTPWPYVVHTHAGGMVRARQVVLCGGGYMQGRPHARLARSVLPIATYVLATEPLGAERARSVMRTQAAVYDTRFAFDYYRMLDNTRLLWGGRISVRDLPPAEVARLLRADMLRVYPQLADVRIDYAWSGLMSYARHKMVQLGRDAHDGIWYALGFGGHGVAPTTLAGELVAEAIVRGPQVLGEFARFEPEETFGPLGLAAAQSTYWYLQARDWLRERQS